MAARVQRDLSTLTQFPPLTALLLDVANLAFDPIGIIILYWVVTSIVVGIASVVNDCRYPRSDSAAQPGSTSHTFS